MQIRFTWLVALLAQISAVTATYTCANITSIRGFADLDAWSIKSSNAANVSGIPFCNASAVIGSRIRVWLMFPAQTAWNGRFVQIGCGGACGYNPFLNTYFNVTGAVAEGFALATTDMGVPSSDNNYAPLHNDLQMRIDWGFLATHLTAVMGKQAAEAYYGSEPKYSYHLGSSTGGRQSLVEAQRYPDDFNGVFAIAPAYNETGVTTYSITYTAKAALLDNVDFTPAITIAEAQILHNYTLGACDALDGLKDGIVSVPRLCHVDVKKLLCLNGQTPTSNASCISQIGMEAALKVYTGPVSSISGGKQVPEGLLPGSEVSWIGTYIPSAAGSPSAWYSFSTSFLSNYAFWPDPADTVTPFNINLSDPTLMRRTSKTEDLEYGGVSDMTKFAQLGGKIIMTQGLQDVAVAPGFARDLYERVGTTMGEQGRDSFMRFFEMPGVNHVSGGVGADTYDALGLIVDWVENGVEPNMIIASKLATNGSVQFTRPFYPYPMVAGYKSGDPSTWQSFEPVSGLAPFWNP